MGQRKHHDHRPPRQGTRCKTCTGTRGAHPNRSTHYEIYSLRDSRRIEFNDMVADGRMPDEDPKEKGFHFIPDQLEIWRSIGMLADHTLFRFDPYEVAAYALGDTASSNPNTSRDRHHPGFHPAASPIFPNRFRRIGVSPERAPVSG